MTATLEATTATAELEALATAYANDERPKHEIHQAVDRLAHPALTPAQAWAAFEDLADAVQLRDDVNEGRADWRQVCDEITGPDPSQAAYEIACERVEDAARALLHPRSAR